MYIIQSKNFDHYLTIEPIQDLPPEGSWFPISAAWTETRAEAVRFTTKYQAQALIDTLVSDGLNALTCGYRIIKVQG